MVIWTTEKVIYAIKKVNIYAKVCQRYPLYVPLFQTIVPIAAKLPLKIRGAPYAPYFAPYSNDAP